MPQVNTAIIKAITIDVINETISADKSVHVYHSSIFSKTASGIVSAAMKFSRP